MTKKHFIALADAIKEHNRLSQRGFNSYVMFTDDQIEVLSRFCGQQSSNFKAERWVRYIHGLCGKNGGEVTL